MISNINFQGTVPDFPQTLTHMYERSIHEISQLITFSELNSLYGKWDNAGTLPVLPTGLQIMFVKIWQPEAVFTVH